MRALAIVGRPHDLCSGRGRRAFPPAYVCCIYPAAFRLRTRRGALSPETDSDRIERLKGTHEPVSPVAQLAISSLARIERIAGASAPVFARDLACRKCRGVRLRLDVGSRGLELSATCCGSAYARQRLVGKPRPVAASYGRGSGRCPDNTSRYGAYRDRSEAAGAALFTQTC